MLSENNLDQKLYEQIRTELVKVLLELDIESAQLRSLSDSDKLAYFILVLTDLLGVHWALLINQGDQDLTQGALVAQDALLDYIRNHYKSFLN